MIIASSSAYTLLFFKLENAHSRLAFLDWLRKKVFARAAHRQRYEKRGSAGRAAPRQNAWEAHIGLWKVTVMFRVDWAPPARCSSPPHTVFVIQAPDRPEWGAGLELPQRSPGRIPSCRHLLRPEDWLQTHHGKQRSSVHRAETGKRRLHLPGPLGRMYRLSTSHLQRELGF